MLQKEVALYNLIRRLRLRKPILPNTKNRLLLCIIALASEYKLLARRLDLNHLAQSMHVTNDLLEIGTRHGNNTWELDSRDRNRPDIQLNQIQRELRHHLLLTVHDLNTQLGRIRLAHEEYDALIVAHRLHELEEVDHVNTENMLLWAVKLIETIRLQTQMNQDRVCAVHRHNLQSCAIKLKIGVRQDILDSLDESTKGSCLDGTDTEKHVGAGIHST